MLDAKSELIIPFGLHAAKIGSAKILKIIQVIVGMAHRGISSAITTLFLIGVAVIGGISAGIAMYEQNEIVTKSTRLEVIKADLVHMTWANKTFFTIDLKNTGTVAIASGTAGFYDKDQSFHSMEIPRLLPGQSFGSSAIFDANVEAGAKYLLHTKAAGTDGSTYEWVQTISSGR
ncbi:MAG: hypothetical protein QW177_07715 [Candidatus Nitrosotenuis sp.]